VVIIGDESFATLARLGGAIVAIIIRDRPRHRYSRPRQKPAADHFCGAKAAGYGGCFAQVSRVHASRP
jgi:hypothetical protein